MKRRKHKRRLNHVLILTSDAADANVKQFRVRAWIVEVRGTSVVCIGRRSDRLFCLRGTALGERQ